jgi:YHS domain-containing protein
MYKRIILLAGVLILAMAISALASPPAKAEKSAANTLAVCGCGKVFIQDASTLYLTVDGKQYACCSKGCHDMASKDPKGAAMMAEKATADRMHQLEHLNLAVANVVAVTEKGTKALCGCGKKFTVDETTEYLSYGGKSYACCSHACHEMAAKDPAAAAKATQEQLAKMEK